MSNEHTKAELEAEYTRMIRENKERIGNYTAREIMTVQRQYLEHELADLSVAGVAIKERDSAANAAYASAQATYEAAQKALLDAAQENKTAWVLLAGHEQTVQHATETNARLTAELEALRRGVDFKVSG